MSEATRMTVTDKVTAYFKKADLSCFRPQGHWIVTPRRWRRACRKAWQLKHGLPKRQAKGFRKHVRCIKAKNNIFAKRNNELKLCTRYFEAKQ